MTTEDNTMPLLAGTNTNALTVPGVPATIDRTTCLQAFQSMGLDTSQVRQIESGMTGLYVTVNLGHADDNGQVAAHRVWIPLTDPS